MPTLEQQVDQLLRIAIDTQADVKEMKQRIARLEDAHEKVYNKLDGFLVLIQRHEAEIAALRSAYDRLTDRLDHLEKKLLPV